LLALAEAGNADYLVTGGQKRLLALSSHKSTRIITARDFAGFAERLHDEDFLFFDSRILPAFV